MTTTNKFSSVLSGESEPVATKDASSSTLPGKSAEVKLCPLTPSVRMLLATLPGDSREVVSTEDLLKRAVYEVSKARG